ncbi:hypothetical protein XFLAVUS301_51880 [Xanthobacter flavus]|uniref:Uncharacterized protein n=1 Tax=Xanthobacter flavus TaxID=281 RepID=A0A9W6FM43_XANFL|nr:hypothetical protein XFLAVUS301_51880 [Xanthobacter flavus]
MEFPAGGGLPAMHGILRVALRMTADQFRQQDSHIDLDIADDPAVAARGRCRGVGQSRKQKQAQRHSDTPCSHGRKPSHLWPKLYGGVRSTGGGRSVPNPPR